MSDKTNKNKKELTLSDGRKAIIKEGKGKDLFWAYRNATEPADIMKLLIIRLTEIDKQPITEETLDELPISDVMLLMKEFMEIYSPLSQ